MKDESSHLNEVLSAGIARARQGAGGDLWTRLLRECGLEAGELRAALPLAQGVLVLSDEQLQSAQLLGDSSTAWPSAGTAWISLDGKAILLCADPWDAQALRLQSGRRGSALALAQQGQLQSLRSRAPAHELPTRAVTMPEDASPVVRFVDDAIALACEQAASDLHFECDRTGIAVKLRIDGVMQPGPRLADEARAEEVISRIKVMAQLDITERRRPQDGRIRWQGSDGRALDLRVSVMPSIFGEDAVLRLLDKSHLKDDSRSISLDSLGFDEELAARIRSLAALPHGMLLVTGPTGSGKTTTVYAALSEVNDGLEKIVTIEDPVEYELPGVLQIPVNEQKGLTFATGLRSILRHDPDKILVGEIRDAETAEIAVQSSLTGHLVMTTVHANSLFDVLGRFQHFGIDPFGLASALNGVIVQRLLRRLCPSCIAWREPTEGERSAFERAGLSVPERVPRAAGCEKCRSSGYKGRMVIAEVHELDDSHRDLIIRRASLTELKAKTADAAAKTLAGAALTRIARGETTFEEVRRVVGPI